MLRVAVSISLGTVRSSTILHKLGTESRKNKLYMAFRELGRVVRTLFLLRFINEEDLRQTIHASTNTVETWNGFVQWVAFGGNGVIRENSREEQRKIIRYNHLVANLLVFHNVVSMTRVLHLLIDEGYPVTPSIVARMSPYQSNTSIASAAINLALTKYRCRSLKTFGSHQRPGTTPLLARILCETWFQYFDKLKGDEGGIVDAIHCHRRCNSVKLIFFCPRILVLEKHSLEQTRDAIPLLKVAEFASGCILELTSPLCALARCFFLPQTHCKEH